MTDERKTISHGCQLLVSPCYFLVGKDFRRQFTMGIYAEVDL